MIDHDLSTTPESELYLPDSARAARQDLSLAEALERLHEGRVLENVRVCRLKLRGTFPRPVRFKNSTLVEMSVDAATFAQEFALTGCTLDQPYFACGSTFQKGLALVGSTLTKPRFHDLTVRGPLSSGHTQWRGPLLVTRSLFEGRVNFWEARLGGWGDFKECLFVGEADFRSLHADSGLVFRDCQFAGHALFRGATLAKKLEFSGSRFEGLLDLSKAKLPDYVYAEGIEQGPNQQFAFLNAVAERIRVTPAQVEGRLASEEAGCHEDAMQEYGLLKRCFNSLHRYEHEDWAFYRFKVNQRRACPRSWGRPWSKLGQFFDWLMLDLGCGYGTNPWRAVRAAGTIILAFAVLYMLGIEQFHVEKKPFVELETTDWPNRVGIGLITSVSMFTSGLSGIRDVAKGWMNVPLIVESLLGTLLWGLFIVAFSRKVIR